jgi:hypothetical protein
MRAIWRHGMLGLGVEQPGGQGLHRLADLQQPDPDRIED